MGFFKDGQFTLFVSLRYTPAAGEISFWCQLMGEVSRLLHDATDGKHSIGQVFVSANSLGGEDADIWVHPKSTVSPNSSGARLWYPTESLDLSQDHTMYPTLLLHELSHYLYGLRDEYTNGSACQRNIATQASVMEALASYSLTRSICGRSGCVTMRPRRNTSLPSMGGSESIGGRPSFLIRSR